PTAKLISAKFLGSNGGTTSNAIKAVDYITALNKPNQRVVATNNSWGGGGYSSALYDAISRANAANILFVAAAGNSTTNIDKNAAYPAGYGTTTINTSGQILFTGLPNVIAVAAIDSAGALASFSNYGATTVHIAAPGVDILSTVPGRKGTNNYARYSGTSMATPHVTGAAALYASLNPCATAAQIKAAILTHAEPTALLQDKVIGSRRLNVANFKTELACP
ncbi:MAG: S8 family serine peptidase, partial [Burkholderiaceae bacterium]